ncbi:hypothetical protein [Cerasicoccus maritimus]|uniref:hypothetical protein n=1 Tax=Cerasicoccus maritimus TaxID=490089 RepID=UPI002852B8E1|nr:hypothetical protein [Cerasicoccus maritimus]
MPKKKKKKEASEGNFMTALVMGIITAVFGMVLGIASLAVEPAAEVRNMPEPDKIEPKTVYYVIGKDNGSYKGLLRAFLEQKPGTIKLSEEDLNRWAADNFKFSNNKAGEDDAGLVTLKPTTPNFHIANGIMTIGMSVEVSVFGKKQKMRFQTSGYFAPSGSGFSFQSIDSYLGSAHLPPVAVYPAVSNTLYSVFENTEQYPGLNLSWVTLSNVALDGDALLLTR